MRRLMIFAGVILIGALILLSCQGKDGAIGPAGPAVGEFSASIYSTGGGYFTPRVFIGFDQCRDIPIALVNGDYLDYQYSNFLSSSEILVNPSDSVIIDIYFTKVNGEEGHSYAAMEMPDPSPIVAPDTDVIVMLQPWEDLAVTWRGSANTSSYGFYYSVRMHYRINQYDSIIQHKGAYILVSDTSFILPYAFMLPESYYSLISISGFCELYSRHEPAEIGDSTDFHGDGYGFVFACSYSSRVDFEIEGLSR